jgi:hypothetical protein
MMASGAGENFLQVLADGDFYDPTRVRDGARAVADRRGALSLRCAAVV